MGLDFSSLTGGFLEVLIVCKGKEHRQQQSLKTKLENTRLNTIQVKMPYGHLMHTHARVDAIWIANYCLSKINMTLFAKLCSEHLSCTFHYLRCALHTPNYLKVVQTILLCFALCTLHTRCYSTLVGCNIKVWRLAFPTKIKFQIGEVALIYQ